MKQNNLIRSASFLQLVQGALAGCAALLTLFWFHASAQQLSWVFVGYVILLSGVALLQNRVKDIPIPSYSRFFVLGASVMVIAVVVTGAVSSFQVLASIVGIWSLMTGVVAVAATFVHRRTPQARDQFASGIVTAVLGLILLVFPFDTAMAYTGAFSTFNALVAVLLLIGALSPKIRTA